MCGLRLPGGGEAGGTGVAGVAPRGRRIRWTVARIVEAVACGRTAATGAG